MEIEARRNRKTESCYLPGTTWPGAGSGAVAVGFLGGLALILLLCAMIFYAEVITAYCDLVHRAGLLPAGRARTSPMPWPCTGPSGRRPRCRGRNGRALRR